MNYYDGNSSPLRQFLHSKGFIFSVIILLGFFSFLGYAMVKLTTTETKKIDIVRVLPAGSEKIALTEDLVKEHMAIHYENEAERYPLVVGFIVFLFLLIVAMGLMMFDRSKRERERYYSEDEEDKPPRKRIAWKIRTVLNILKVLCLISMIILAIYWVMTGIKGKFDPAEKKAIIEQVTVADKYEKIRHSKSGRESTYYYVAFDNGDTKSVPYEEYLITDIGHSYYLGKTSQGAIFAIYDTEIYEFVK